MEPFLIALTMVNSPLMQTANVAISKFTGSSQFDTYGAKMSAGVIVTVPLIIMVLVFQRRASSAASRRRVGEVTG